MINGLASSQKTPGAFLQYEIPQNIRCVIFTTAANFNNGNIDLNSKFIVGHQIFQEINIQN